MPYFFLDSGHTSLDFHLSIHLVRSTWKMRSKRYWRLFEQWKASRKNGKYLRRAKFRNEENLKQSCLLCSCYQGTLNDSAKFPFFIFRILRIPFLEFFLPFSCQFSTCNDLSNFSLTPTYFCRINFFNSNIICKVFSNYFQVFNILLLEEVFTSR